MKTISNNLRSEEEELDLVLLEELGALAFENTLTSYFAELEDEQEIEAFNIYLTTHVAEENILEIICEKYPRFQELLQAEINTLKDEFESIKKVKK